MRPGTNLFTNSFVALDALTGQLKWWHQLVRPDFHDWDTSVLAAFDTADGSHLVAGAFSPASGLLYMNGIDWCGSAIKGPTPTYQPGKSYLGWATPSGYAKLDPVQQAFRLINAFEPGNGRLMWSYRLATRPLAGLIATAGNIVITGEVNGNLIVLDAKIGALLYRDSLNAGALDGGLITYSVDGKQSIAAAAGDNNPTYEVNGENTIVVLGLKP